MAAIEDRFPAGELSAIHRNRARCFESFFSDHRSSCFILVAGLLVSSDWLKVSIFGRQLMVAGTTLHGIARVVWRLESRAPVLRVLAT